MLGAEIKGRSEEINWGRKVWFFTFLATKVHFITKKYKLC